jgi:mono/diheme cytochrome c family protein
MCANKKSVQFEFPETMSETLKNENQVNVEKGLALYKISCAKCHTDTVKGKEMIPDFTSEQLSNYEFRIANKKHENNLGETQITQDELILINMFFNYKKKNK